METLTERQEAILEFITSFLEQRKAPPSIREIQKYFCFGSTNAVVGHLTQLERKVYLKRRLGISRGIELVSKCVSFHPGVANVPVLGQIAAGLPTLSEENIEGYLSLDQTLVRGEGHFLLRVRGDSMKGAGILDKDLVLVKKISRAQTGDIVAAYLNGEATVKRFWARKNRVELRAENPVYSPIRIVKEKYPDFQILGKVRAVLRLF